MSLMDSFRTRRHSGHLVPAAVLCLAATLAGCSRGSPAPEPAPPGTVTSAPASAVSASSAPVTSTRAGSVPASPDPASSAPASSAAATSAFTVAGVNPVVPNGSQDTYAQTPGTTCDSAKLSADRALGAEIAAGFALDGFPVASSLLTHFLTGQGTAVDYPAGSEIAKEARASSAFRAVNSAVQQAVLAGLGAGQTRVQLSAAQLPTVSFEDTASDLYWGFRGTQGLTVTGSGSRENRRYTGTLSYVIRDSYGFPATDTLQDRKSVV